MLVYTISDAIAVILLIFLIVVAVMALLVSKVSNWFGRWWKKPTKDEPIVIDKTTKDYSELFLDSNGNPRDVETRIFIKALAEKGYSTEEITEILRKMVNTQ